MCLRQGLPQRRVGDDLDDGHMRGRDRMHGARPRAAANVLCKEGEVSVALLVCRSSVIAGLVAAAAGMAVGEMTPAPLLMDNLDEDVDVAVGSREPLCSVSFKR